MNNKDLKLWIDNATFEELFHKIRFEPIESIWFKDDIGNYFMKVFNEHKSNIDDLEYTNISKTLDF